MKRLSLLLLLCTFFSAVLSAQTKPPLTGPSGAPLQPENVAKPQPFAPQIPAAERTIFQEASQFKALAVPARSTAEYPNLDFAFSPDNGLPVFVKGTPEALDKTADLLTQVVDYLHLMRLAMQIETPDNEWLLISENTDALGQTHLHLQQQYQGIPVYGSEVRLHAKDGVINLMNGRYFPTPSLATMVPSIAENAAVNIAQTEVQNHATVHDLNGFEHLIAGAPVSADLVVFHSNNNTKREQLAWHIRLIPNLADRWEYFVDARTGAILNSYNNVCHLHGHAEVAPKDIATAQKTVAAKPLNTLTNNSLVVGPATANATDLLGQTRFINTYEEGGNYFMLDASRAMYNASQSSMPDDPAGCIWTIDALNNSFEGNNFELAHVSDNDNNWNAPKGVSAHFNAGQAYEYFVETFNRNSINGMGGNIISIINVEENNGPMDNAFWNGAAMFYGNGNTAFQPLARALDVAGHEMSHGVVQATANLEYQGESGAMNESFADIFGAMMDREDWQMGEDCVNTSAFPSGALRDLSDPHQGGSGLSSPGWQPSHYNERYTGNQDNGGVHINSGIPNHAYYLYAEAIGKDKAEQIFYRALTEYLIKSSKFVDLRFAVEQSAEDLYTATEVTEAQNAFNAVGIGSGGGGNTSGGGGYQDDLDINPGSDYILMSDASQDQLYIFEPDGTAVANPLSTISPISRPSITDDGSAIVYIAADKTMQLITIDWDTGANEQSTLQDEPIWRNVAVSKDGSRLAALTDDLDNRVWIYDFNFEEWVTYDLYNPTYTEGVSTGDVVYADILEWDFTGDWVMYDAFNRLESSFGDDIEYWDIGFIRTFDSFVTTWGDGAVEKLFSGLPENVSVGNPTFSKNSDYIVAFDWIDESTNNVELRAGNLQTGDLGTIFTNSILNVPNYSTDDAKMVFDGETQGGTRVLAFIDIADDKINNAGNDASVFLEGGHWGVWFAEGSRILNDASEVSANPLAISISPNPFSEVINIQIPNSVENVNNRIELELVDLMGKVIATKTAANTDNITWNVAAIPAENYFLKVTSDEQMSVVKILKIK